MPGDSDARRESEFPGNGNWQKRKALSGKVAPRIGALRMTDASKMVLVSLGESQRLREALREAASQVIQAGRNVSAQQS